MSPVNAGERFVGLEAAPLQMERQLIEQALRECRGNKSRAATRLGLTRNELDGRLRQYRLT